MIGVSTALVPSGDEGGSVGLGLAIPANDAQFVVSRLLGPGRLQLGWDHRKRPHSAAADRGITAGSLLVSVDRHPVTSLADLQLHIDAARSANNQFVLMLVEDQQGLQWMALPLGSR